MLLAGERAAYSAPPRHASHQDSRLELSPSPYPDPHALPHFLRRSFPHLLLLFCLRTPRIHSQHANYAGCIPTYTSEVLESLPTGTENRVQAAEAAACSDLKEMGWECTKLTPEVDSCAHDCTRSRRAMEAAAAYPRNPRCPSLPATPPSPHPPNPTHGHGAVLTTPLAGFFCCRGHVHLLSLLPVAGVHLLR